MFSDTPITPRGNPLDTLCATLEEKCQYGPGERDLVLRPSTRLSQKLTTNIPTRRSSSNTNSASPTPTAGKRRAHRHSSSMVIRRGIPRWRSWSGELLKLLWSEKIRSRQCTDRACSIPCGIAVLMVLDGRISETGILAPMKEELAAPLREELKKTWGIEMLEKEIV